MKYQNIIDIIVEMLRKPEEEVVASYYADCQEDEKKQLVTELLQRFGVELNEFISQSQGYGRPKRRNIRPVTFLHMGDRTWTISEDGEAVRPSDHNRIGLDRIAQETLTHLPEDERTVDALLGLAREITSRKKR